MVRVVVEVEDCDVRKSDLDIIRRLVRDLEASTDSLARAVCASDSSISFTPRAQSETTAMANPVIQQLIDAVTRNKVVVDSAVLLIQGIGDRITDAVNQALANGATAAELAPLTDLVTTLATETDALAAAVAANTPATPTAKP